MCINYVSTIFFNYLNALQVLNGIPDQDLYYDVTDALEEQGISNFISYYINNASTDDDLLEQLRIYEVVLQHEDEGGQNRSLRETSKSVSFC
jgi:hypothetical protein